MRRGFATLLAAGSVLAVTWGLSRSAAAEGQVDIEGTWYVIVHYLDDNSPNPEQERWEDKIWVLERSGSRLKWREYPIVVFDDEEGRFERRGTGQYARVLHFWEPNESQRADIRDGLQVNDRGSKTKTLRGSDSKGWATRHRARPSSASVVSYTEHWSIDNLPSEPTFTRRDIMGSGRSDSLEGVTRYTTTEVMPSGNRLRGSFVRDGTRRGTFRMMRAGPLQALSSKKTQRDLQREAGIPIPGESPEAP
ncbi:hypothetical protein MK489_03855 [Myxococcota bacterium]|nr:hypothetical protein [Myxococcota bacterium]